MTAVTISAAEGLPAAYPSAPDGLLSPDAAALNSAFIWARLEHWIAYRWPQRAVVWIAEGAGQWRPPLTPATVNTIEVWRDDEWQAIEPRPTPLGGWQLTGETYQLTGTAGDDSDPPGEFWEAFRRLAEYAAAETRAEIVGASMVQSTIDVLTTRYRRDPAHLARALQNSGAADLLRPYRRP